METTTTLNVDQNILIRSTEYTPQVEIYSNKLTCTITGNLYCVDPSVFFSPLIAWAKGFSNISDRPFTVELNLSHINSSSVAYLLKFMRVLLGSELKNESSLAFHWFIKEYDEDMQETARLFNEILGDKIEIIIDRNNMRAKRRMEIFKSIGQNFSDKLFISKFSPRYNQDVIVLNPLFFFLK
jgi:hypothetical protein